MFVKGSPFRGRAALPIWHEGWMVLASFAESMNDCDCFSSLPLAAVVIVTAAAALIRVEYGQGCTQRRVPCSHSAGQLEKAAATDARPPYQTGASRNPSRVPIRGRIKTPLVGVSCTHAFGQARKRPPPRGAWHPPVNGPVAGDASERWFLSALSPGRR
jgi:hypothetical protein